MSVTTGTTFSLGLGGIFGFVRAVAGDLPDPSGVSVYSHGNNPSAYLLFDSLDDLRNWAAYLQVPVTAKPVPVHKSIHHGADAKWGPVDGKMVGFHMVFIEDVPEAPAIPEAWHMDTGDCTDECNPGNCEVQHHEQFAIPKDCDAAEWS